MKKLFTFLLALMTSSCLWASITYELNGGKHNDYEWKDKGDMYYAILVDINAITSTTKIDFNTISLEADKQKAVNLGIPTYWGDLSALLNNAGFKSKWGWLIDYMDAACSAQSKSLASSSSTYLRYNLGAFFIESNASTYLHAVYDVLGKDAAYLPAWGQNYPNPTDPTEEVTLVAPYRAGYLFDGWYASADFSGEKVTTVDQNTTGTLYAKWVSDGIVYELNGGKYNDYGWTSKADICLALEADYNTAAGASKDWVKKEGDVIKYCVNGTWVTEEEAKGSAANIAGFIHNNTWTADGKFSTLILTTKADKYGWLKEMITANREAQSITLELNDAAYRQEVSAFFLCSPTLTASGVTSSSYESTGDYEDYQPYWGQAFPNPEHPTAEVVLNNPVKEGYEFGGWYKEADFSGTPITIVDQNFKGTLYAKWTQSGIVYELNGGVWNQYGWESKKDMYDAFLADWKAYSGSTKTSVTYEEQLGAGNSKNGIPAVMYGNDANGNSWKSKLLTFFTDANYSAKWGWLATYLDVVAATQYKKMNAANGPKIQPSTNGDALAYSLGNFFGEDNYYTTNYIDAVDFTGSEAQVEAFQYTWGQSFPGIEHPTESTVLHIAYKQRHNFEGWYDNAECTGTAITTVDETYAGTLYAKWSIAPITYNLNGGQYNEYGWETKEDIYNDFLKDWKAYEGADASGRGVVPFETQLGVGNGSKGVPTTIHSTDFRNNLPGMFTHADYQAKWGWLATYIDAVAEPQGTQPTTNGATLTFSLGNFFGEDKNSNYSAVDFTGEAKELYMAQSYCSFTLPNPMYPTKEVTLNNPTKEGYIFDGWYAAADFSGAAVTKVNEDTKGTLYAKWKEDAYTRTVTNGNYGTICLPKGSKQTSGAIFYELAYKDARYVYLDQVTTLEAGVPYIFKATGNLLKVVYNTTEVATAGNHNGLYGTFVEIQDAATSDPNNVLEGNYLLVSNTIKKCGGNCKVLANRAYIILEEIPNSASAAPGRNRVSMKYEGENEATGLDNITEDSNIVPALQGTYDIMGRKLTEPSTTGFYIVNGKKIIIMK